MYSHNIEKLNEHIITTVYEGLLKLGTSGDEDYSIYYDLDLINYLIGTAFASNEECYDLLHDLYNNSNHSSPISLKLNISLSLQKGRFCFTVPATSMDYVRSQGEKNGFLFELIELVKSHTFTLDDIKRIFSRYSNSYVCEETNHPEFQYVLYFKDKEINHYMYCFTFDGCGGYYHRLLDYDYKKLIK